MNTIQTTALVLKTCNMNDNDKLITFFSPEEGRITAIAKGVRSHKHKDFAALQQFCYSDIVISSKQGGLYTVSSTNVKNNFFNLRNDVLKVSFTAYYMDVVADIAQEIVGDSEYFNFVLNTLYLTENAEKSAKDGDVLHVLKKLKMIFEIKTVVAMGVMPELSRCVVCGKDKKLNNFSAYDGGVVCDECLGRYKGRENPPKPLGETEIKVLDYIAKSDHRSVFNFYVTDEILYNVFSVAERYMISQTDTYYKSLSYLHNIMNENL